MRLATSRVVIFLAPVWLPGDCDAAAAPQGHLEPFGGWAPGTAVEERADVPEPQEFYKKYGEADDSHGRPVIFRGAAARMAAAQWGTDEDLLRRFGSQKVSGVEYNLKETRAGGTVEGMNTMADFLQEYNRSDIYLVSSVPDGMLGDVEFLPCLRCGGYLRFLESHMMWMGRGGSKSVIHYDDQDNINCMFAGRKRFILMHPSYKQDFESHPNTERNRYGWVDTDLDKSVPGYGAFMGRLDVDAVDLLSFPGWATVNWSFADLEPGDCLYIPHQWYHQVTAEPERSINVHVWYYRPKHFDAGNCETRGKDTKSPTFGDCTWGYEPQVGHLGITRSGGMKTTRCFKSKARDAEL